MSKSAFAKKPVLLFDLFGVIAKYQSEKDKLCLERLAKTEPASFWAAYWKHRSSYDQGQPTVDYWRTIAMTLGTHYSSVEIEALIKADVESWNQVDERVVGYLCSLSRQGYRLALLSNIPRDIAEHYESQKDWLDLFSLRGFSCRIGHAKPSAEAYYWCCQNLVCQPEEIVFIDDRESNVAAAVTLGLVGHTFTRLEVLRDFLEFPK